ncbi:MAG: COR domain-containing protein [Saprospiraceae bacterium]
MSNDLALIKSMEKAFGFSLKSLSAEALSEPLRFYFGNPVNINRGYQLNEEGQIVGLRLPYTNLAHVIDVLLNFNHIRYAYLTRSFFPDAPKVLKKWTQLSSLYLRSNNISDASFVKELTQLSSLDLSANPQIKDFSFVKELTQLSSLDLRANNISDASFVKALTQLSSLDLSDNNISDASFVKELTQLSSLYLSYNKQIKDFSFVKELTQLSSLYLSNNPQIKDFSFVKELTQLSSLDLSYNNISDASFVKELIQLSSLYLSYNKQIKDFSFVKELTQLSSLDLSNNNISDASFVKELTQLSSLDLSANNISDASFVKELTQLSSLDLRANNISDASFVKELTQLSSLDLRANNISDASFVKALTQLSSLDLSANNISDASFVKALTQLSSLYLRANNISDASFVKELTQLSSLYLRANNISDASFVKELTQLSSLDLRANNISDASFVKELTQLSSLDLSANPQIKDFSFVKELTQLSSLYLRANNISDASFVKELTQLSSLDLSDNKLSGIPAEICHLSSLTNLNLAKNEIKEIPKELMTLNLEVVVDNEYASGLNLTENPIENPPLEIVKEGRGAMLNYFQQLDELGKAYLYEAKLLIVGKGGAGKTSLARKLLQEDAQLPEEEETTKGIEIHQLPFTTEGGKDFTIHLWDFGGQEIYHATHQFFLTKRSLYVLVDDTREDDKSLHDPSFNYWLQTVRVFGGDSALLIVQNQKGDRSKDIDLRSMQAQFDNIRACHKTNLLTKANLAQVKAAIIYHIQQLPHIGQVLPLQWVNIRDHLETLKAPYIGLDKYYEICAQYEIPEKDKALSLSRYLHDLGVFLHFQDDGLLRKTVILQNDWATQAAYRVLDNEEIKDAKGRFGRRHINALWGDSAYEDMHSELLQLMKNFELCYALQGLGEETYLVPQLLPLSQPKALSWEDSQLQLQLRYQYSFMPRGLLSRFIVRLHRYVLQPALAWKNGVVLEREGTQALVTATYDQREILIKVKGNERKALMTIVKEELDTLNNTFEGIEVEKLIPCNCSFCTASTEPHFFKFRSLVKRKIAGQPTIECDISFEDVPVLQLIDDVFIENLTPGAPGQSLETRRMLEDIKEELREIKEKRSAEPKVEINITQAGAAAAPPAAPMLPPSPPLKWYEAWWVKSLAGGIGGGFILAVITYRFFGFPFLDTWLGAAAIVGGIILFRNPKHKYYRMASLVLGLFSTLNLLPAFDATFKITEASTDSGWKETLFKLGLQDSPMISIGLLALVAWLVYLDFNKK